MLILVSGNLNSYGHRYSSHVKLHAFIHEILNGRRLEQSFDKATEMKLVILITKNSRLHSKANCIGGKSTLLEQPSFPCSIYRTASVSTKLKYKGDLSGSNYGK